MSPANFDQLEGCEKDRGGLEHGIRILVRTLFVHTVVKWYEERLGCLLSPLINSDNKLMEIGLRYYACSYL